MAVHASHAALPYPVKGARYSMLVPFLDADGDPTDGTALDTEISEDNGAFTDAAEEVSLASGTRGMGLITFTGAETDCTTLGVWFGASTAKATLAVLYPRALAEVSTGTLSAGSAGGGTLGTVLAYDVTGCIVKTTGGTGGGGAGGANNQARVIATYNTGTGAFTVVPNWETTPDSTTTYALLLPEGVTLGMLRALNPTTAGRTLTVESDGMGHSDVKEWKGSAPASLADTDKVSVSVQHMATGIITAAVIADAAIDAATFAAGAITADAIAADAIGSSELAASAITEIQSGLSTLDAAGVRTAVGLASANLDTQLDALPTAAENAAAALTTQMTESYNADGAAPTLAQAAFVIMQRLTEFAIAGTTVTVKKLNGTTTALTLTLDSDTAPTSSTRAT